MIRKTLAATAALVLAAVVALVPQQAATVAPEAPAIPVTLTAVQPVAEDDPAWDCRAVTAHSNGVCGSDLPQGFTVQDITECTVPASYSACPDAVRVQLGR